MSAERRADIAFALAVLLGVGLLFVTGAVARRDVLVGHGDFSYIWAGPRTILDGGDPYDAAAWSASVARLDTELFDDPAVYSYPPHVAIALLPLGALPLRVAAFIWAWAGLALAAVGLRALLHTFVRGQPVAHAAAGLALTISQPAAISFLTGQWSHVLLAASAGLVVAFAPARRDGLGALTAVLTVKPQLFALTVPAFVLAAAWRGRSRLAWTMVGAAAAPSLVALVVRPGWWISWAEAVPFARSQEPNITTLLASTRPLGTAGLIVTAIVIAAGAVIATASGPRSLRWLALWLVFGVMAAPYSRSYDHLLLLVPAVVAGTVLTERGAALGIVAMTLLLVIGSWAMMLIVAPPRGSESLSAAIAVAGFAIVAVPWFLRRHRDAA
jgi:hypothetical protein